MSLFPETLESARLRYEAIRPAAFDPFEMYEHVNPDAPGIDDVTEYVTWDPHDTPNETAEFVEHAGEQREANEAVHYAIYPTHGAHEEAFVGTTGLSVDWDRQLGELGIWLRPVVWGNGYSGERAGRLFDLAFDRLDLACVAVEHAVDNKQSARAVEKYVERFGGRREGRLRNAIATQSGEVLDTVRYTVRREEWAAAVAE